MRSSELPFRRVLALAPVVLAATLACQSSISPSEDQLAAAELQWQDEGVNDYSMIITRSTLNGPPIGVRLTVVGGTVTERRYALTDGEVPAGETSKYPDVEELFALVRAAFDDADAVTVSFNATYGYPESVIIDYIRSTIEDDVGFAVSEFTPAP